MACNLKMAKMLGLSDNTIDNINKLHSQLDSILETAHYENTEEANENALILIECTETKLQILWGFTEDKSKHTWGYLYKFKCKWVGRVFECNTTEELFTIPCDVKERYFYTIGDGFLDVGMLDGYCRWGGIKEIV